MIAVSTRHQDNRISAKFNSGSVLSSWTKAWPCCGLLSSWPRHVSPAAPSSARLPRFLWATRPKAGSRPVDTLAQQAFVSLLISVTPSKS